ncbi:hypothetical protein HDG32_006897 [Paraburkholderia sp. CI2]|uniref:hypothetical protein n=1 Tax=Paraburkholderia sp. CI2 TaxID=2723093 RepID=UPI0016135FFC|nr:hypothetical protein [Paraburkholderia sp. CI2]MBB5470743.1 hypothetical protein [Paraburkholderia sp. CI2]
MSSHPFAESFDLEAAFAGVSDHWSPKAVAQVNDQYVKAAKVRGQLVRHDHEHDECWIVLIEPVQIKHTGNVQSPLKRTIQRR